MENPTRSDFFIVMSILAVLIGEQSGDSCGISGRDETPQERKRSLIQKSTVDFY
ncbi:hypothetical protein O0Q50_00420 [Priestia aryabhattai]|uniref:Uncharacterized protein n=1 Tax=Priestia aryabhattai TaxID=412384 RepID=A0AAX6N1F0_PRIAR|nr:MULTISPECIES: hypothetical protein [Priestia]MDU9689617.1 hypothetical protein [Priestia aryabhattai]